MRHVNGVGAPCKRLTYRESPVAVGRGLSAFSVPLRPKPQYRLTAIFRGGRWAAQVGGPAIALVQDGLVEVVSIVAVHRRRNLPRPGGVWGGAPGLASDERSARPALALPVSVGRPGPCRRGCQGRQTRAQRSLDTLRYTADPTDGGQSPNTRAKTWEPSV